MANELAVKVKVNLDTSATKLKDDLKTLEGNLQNHPVKIAVKIDKKSLENSLKEAFGKDAVNSIQKSMQDALSKASALKNGTSKVSNDSVKQQSSEEKAALNQVISALQNRNKLQVQYYNELKRSGDTASADRINELVKDANVTLSKAIDNAHSLGVAFDQDEKYIQALNEGLVKVNNAEQNLRKSQNNSATKAQAEEDKAALNAEKDAIEAIIDAENRLAQATVNYNKAKASGNSDKEKLYLGEMTQANQDFAVATAAADKLGVAWRTNKDRLDALYESQVKVAASDADFAAAQTKAANATDSLNTTISNTIEKANALNATTQKNGAGKVDMTAFNQAFQEFNDIANNTSGKYSDLKVKSDALQKSLQKMSIAAGNINTTLKDNSAVTRAKTNFANLNAQITRFLNNNPRVSSNAGIYAQFQALATATKECSGDIDKLRMEEAQLEAQSERLGLTTETLAGKFSRLFKEHFQTAFVMAGIHLVQQGFQQVYQNVSDVDAAMTELKKVTDETDATYSSFMQTAIQQSRDLASSISDTVNATADFARLGYTLDEATDLSKAAITYQHVGDGISDISEATESIISTMKAFNIEAKDSMSIVDRFNKVGNEFAISSSGIGEALQRSASALHTAGNDINESIGMIVAANDVVQDEESVGNALKVLSLRIRGAKTELKEMGEDTDTVAESTSKLQASIKGLTGVDIMKSATEFKSTYQIMDELAAKWKELDDISKASTLEQLAGKNRANVVAGMLENWQDAKAAADAARDSYGSAEAELDKYKESIAGLSEQLKASFGALSETLLDDNIVKGLLKIATGISDATNEAIKFVGVLPTVAAALSGAFAVGGPKLTGSLYVPTNTLMVTWNELAA